MWFEPVFFWWDRGTLLGAGLLRLVCRNHLAPLLVESASFIVYHATRRPRQRMYLLFLLFSSSCCCCHPCIIVV
jgi:hypothetical protein